MGKRTPFYELHAKANAKIVDFAGWDMPLHYGSQLQEHHQVRQKVGMFDVSHMGIVDLAGKEVSAYLRFLLANNVDKIGVGKALYTCMLNEQGGVIDDLIVYQLDKENYRLVINAGTREKDIAWMKKQAHAFNLTFSERTDLAMLAIQGPEALAKLDAIFSATEVSQIQALKPFSFITYNDIFIARTGYTGEDGVEIILPATKATEVWNTLLAAQVLPCGLGARDTLRLEAGLNLYGSDMDETVSPLESNLAWTVAMEPKERRFIGRDYLEQQVNKGLSSQLVGLILEGAGIIRNHQRVVMAHSDKSEGEITSGGYSPTLEKSIALARIPKTAEATCFVVIRDKQVPAKIVKPPFVRHGKKVF